MNHIKALTIKRDKLLTELSNFNDIIAGNLSKVSPPNNKKSSYWRITWKEDQKTKIQYVRNTELPEIKKGIKKFAQLKMIIQQIGEINRTIVLLQHSSLRS